MLTHDILVCILSELDPILYYKCLAASRIFHIDDARAKDIYMRNKYAGYSLKDLIIKKDVEGVKYSLESEPSNIMNLSLSVNKDSRKNIIDIISMLCDKDNYDMELTLNFKVKEKGKLLHGLKKPIKLSPILCDFFNMPLNTRLSRADVAGKIWKYVKATCPKFKHQYSNSWYYYPDDILMKLMNISRETSLSYTDIQRYIKHHYI